MIRVHPLPLPLSLLLLCLSLCLLLVLWSPLCAAQYSLSSSSTGVSSVASSPASASSSSSLGISVGALVGIVCGGSIFVFLVILAFALFLVRYRQWKRTQDLETQSKARDTKDHTEQQQQTDGDEGSDSSGQDEEEEHNHAADVVHDHGEMEDGDHHRPTPVSSRHHHRKSQSLGDLKVIVVSPDSVHDDEDDKKDEDDASGGHELFLSHFSPSSARQGYQMQLQGNDNRTSTAPAASNNHSVSALPHSATIVSPASSVPQPSASGLSSSVAPSLTSSSSSVAVSLPASLSTSVPSSSHGHHLMISSAAELARSYDDELEDDIEREKQLRSLFSSLRIDGWHIRGFLDQHIGVNELMQLTAEQLTHLIPSLRPRRYLQQYINERNGLATGQAQQARITATNTMHTQPQAAAASSVATPTSPSISLSRAPSPWSDQSTAIHPGPAPPAGPTTRFRGASVTVLPTMSISISDSGPADRVFSQQSQHSEPTTPISHNSGSQAVTFASRSIVENNSPTFVSLSSQYHHFPASDAAYDYLPAATSVFANRATSVSLMRSSSSSSTSPSGSNRYDHEHSLISRSANQAPSTTSALHTPQHIDAQAPTTTPSNPRTAAVNLPAEEKKAELSASQNVSPTSPLPSNSESKQPTDRKLREQNDQEQKHQHHSRHSTQSKSSSGSARKSQKESKKTKTTSTQTAPADASANNAKHKHTNSDSQNSASTSNSDASTRAISASTTGQNKSSTTGKDKDSGSRQRTSLSHMLSFSSLSPPLSTRVPHQHQHQHQHQHVIHHSQKQQYSMTHSGWSLSHAHATPEYNSNNSISVRKGREWEPSVMHASQVFSLYASQRDYYEAGEEMEEYEGDEETTEEGNSKVHQEETMTMEPEEKKHETEEGDVYVSQDTDVDEQ